MINIGEVNKLSIVRRTDNGLYLADEEGTELLLPNKYCPEKYEFNDIIEVFVMRDSEDRIMATTIDPKIHLYEFALLQVTHVTRVGAFMDWGMEKELMVPYSEQRQGMEEGRWYVVCMLLDEKTDRLFASNKIDKYLQNNVLNVEVGQKVEALVYQRSDLGYSVIINNEHTGLIYANEVYKELNVGDKLEAYIKAIREDNKLDISVHPIGYESSNELNVKSIYQALTQHNGEIFITDKSTPEVIYKTFNISKKAFKKAIGDLYRQRKISIEESSIKLVE